LSNICLSRFNVKERGEEGEEYDRKDLKQASSRDEPSDMYSKDAKFEPWPEYYIF
jgi:hypothetical protein